MAWHTKRNNFLNTFIFYLFVTLQSFQSFLDFSNSSQFLFSTPILFLLSSFFFFFLSSYFLLQLGRIYCKHRWISGINNLFQMSKEKKRKSIVGRKPKLSKFRRSWKYLKLNFTILAPFKNPLNSNNMIEKVEKKMKRVSFGFHSSDLYWTLQLEAGRNRRAVINFTLFGYNTTLLFMEV